MRALSAREVKILNAYALDVTTVTIVGHVPQSQLSLVVYTASSVPPQTVILPPSQRKYQKYCNPAREINNSTIWNNEGTHDKNGNVQLATTGYVPSGSSGVTVGYGIDLGTSGSSAQAIATQLTTWGLSAAGLQTLTPYLGLTGSAALNAIATLGAPVISTLDAQTISSNAVSSYADHAASQFNGYGNGIQFDQIPQNGQTALTDVAYWAWSFSSAALPSGFSSALAQGDLTTAGALLRSSGNSRLAADGQLLQSAAAQLPKPGQQVDCGSVGP